jgi:hypothetical protein
MILVPVRNTLRAAAFFLNGRQNGLMPVLASQTWFIQNMQYFKNMKENLG